MIAPNKLIPFNKSIIAHFVFVLEELQDEAQSLNKLYQKINNRFEDINQYILTLDVLYMLEKIKLCDDNKVSINAKTNKL